MKDKLIKLRAKVAEAAKEYQKLLKQLKNEEDKHIQEELTKIGENCVFYEVWNHPAVEYLIIKDFKIAVITEDERELKWERVYKSYTQSWIDIIFDTSNNIRRTKHDPKVVEVAPIALLTHKNKYIRALAKKSLAKAFHKLS